MEEHDAMLGPSVRGDQVWLVVFYEITGMESYAASQIVDTAIKGVEAMYGFVKLAGVHCTATAYNRPGSLQYEYGVANCRLPAMFVVHERQQGSRAERVPYMANMDRALPPVLQERLSEGDLARFKAVERDMARAREIFLAEEEKEKKRYLQLSPGERQEEDAERTQQEMQVSYVLWCILCIFVVGIAYHVIS